jgi:hypothetical protein
MISMTRAAKSEALDRDELRRGYVDEGLTIDAVATRLHVSPTSVKRALKAAGIPVRAAGRRPWAPDDLGAIAERFDAGESIGAIAAASNVHTMTVRRRLAAMGKATTRTPLSHRLDDRRWLERTYTRVGSIAAVAVQLGCAPETVRMALVEHDIPRFKPGRPSRDAARRHAQRSASF